MRYPQLIFREDDGALARALRPAAERRKWVVREPGRLDSCFRLLTSGHPCVLVLTAGRDVVRELTFLERCRWLCPETPVVVVSEADSLPLMALAWHLGATAVLTRPQARDQLEAVVSGLMDSAIEQGRIGPALPPGAATVPTSFTESEGAESDD